MKLLWYTDVHFNFLPDGGARAFGRYERAEHSGANAAVVTGDIGEYHDFAELIEEFAEGLGLPVWFVLGNHDSYRGSVAGAKEQARALSGRARWLESSDPVSLSPGVALLGVDGWYDARFGNARRSVVVMSDFMLVEELLEAGASRDNPGEAVVKRCNQLGDAAASLARKAIWEAVGKGCRKIVFATHVPPFAQATWHEGKVSNQDWLPWMSSRSMGAALRDSAKAHPGVEFLVLCGHTHSPGEYRAEPNMLVLTGESVYGRPRLSRELDL